MEQKFRKQTGIVFPLCMCVCDPGEEIGDIWREQGKIIGYGKGTGVRPITPRTDQVPWLYCNSGPRDATEFSSLTDSGSRVWWPPGRKY